MQRRRPRAGGESAHTAVRRHEVQAGLDLNEMVDLERSAKMAEIRAAPHADVLAGVNELAGCRVIERAGAAAEPIARFQERDAKAARGKGRRRRQAREAAADDNDAWLHYTSSNRAGNADSA